MGTITQHTHTHPQPHTQQNPNRLGMMKLNEIFLELMIPTSSSNPIGLSVHDGVAIMIHERFISSVQECGILSAGGWIIECFFSQAEIEKSGQWMAVTLNMQPEMLKD